MEWDTVASMLGEGSGGEDRGGDGIQWGAANPEGLVARVMALPLNLIRVWLRVWPAPAGSSWDRRQRPIPVGDGW